MESLGIRSFGSDNHSGVHPKIMDAIINTNIDHAISYGEDPWTSKAILKFKSLFNEDTKVFFTFNGIGSNVLGLLSAILPHEAVICSSLSHIFYGEAGSPERITGCKLLPVYTSDGKITIESLGEYLAQIGDQGCAQPKIVSLTQPNELGLVYTVEETIEISEYIHGFGMYLHMDGARISNAAVALNKTFKELTLDAGVDILSFGGTKNGMMYGEALLFLNPSLGNYTNYLLRQTTQQSSKMRFISAQYLSFFEDELWKKNAKQSNKMALSLGEALKSISQIKITQPIQTNMVFIEIEQELLNYLSKTYFFYASSSNNCEVRLMTSFDINESDILEFVSNIKEFYKMPQLVSNKTINIPERKINFKDFFSDQSKSYVNFRPRYPKELYKWIYQYVSDFSTAWDCATGNGQAAIDLVDDFEKVIASDASITQIENSIPHPKISYVIAPAEKTEIDDSSIDLLTVAQAINWFQFEQFYSEAKRVLKPKGIIAIWGYDGFPLTGIKKTDDILNKLGRSILEKYWLPESKLIWDQYKNIPFPFVELPSHEFEIKVNWKLSELLGYYASWSATQSYIRENGDNPIELIFEDLFYDWGDPDIKKELKCPIVLKIGKLN